MRINTHMRARKRGMQAPTVRKCMVIAADRAPDDTQYAHVHMAPTSARVTRNLVSFSTCRVHTCQPHTGQVTRAST